jgi:alpha-galactosidase
MEDGSLAVGLFNLGEVPRHLRVDWTEVGLTGSRRVRDLWRQKEVGDFEDHFEVLIPRHGVVAVRIWPAERK